jgi:hypothetical protein
LDAHRRGETFMTVSARGLGALPSGVAGAQPGWSTPRKLRALRAAVWVAAGLLLLFGDATMSQLSAAFKTIGTDTVPSIIAAEEIGYALADLDANVANALLGNAAHKRAADATIERERVKVTDSLIDAAQNITYGDAEKVPIRMMTRDVGRYLELAAEARLRSASNDAAGARLAYWSATELLHQKLLTEAGDLDNANKVHLDAAYRDGGRETAGAEIVVIALGLLLMGSLVVLQIYLLRKTRRILSPALLAATLLAGVLAVGLAYRFTTARDSLRVAKEDAFDSIHALVRARAIAYDANGDESRFLLDPGGGHGFEPAFRGKVRALTSAPHRAAPPPADLDHEKRAKDAGRAPAATGLLWDELYNITFRGEYEAASSMVMAFSAYVVIDEQIRKLMAAGRMDEAIELCIGDKADESNAAFDRFDRALSATLQVNRDAFDREMDTTRRDLRSAETTSTLLAVLIAALTWLGLRPRLREYAT